MRLNLTSVGKVMTIWISRELPLINFECVDILCARIGLPCEKLWPFEFLESFRCSIFSVSICDAPESNIRVKSYDHLNFSRASDFRFLASRYVMRLNRTSEWQVMTIWISRKLPLFNYERLDILCAWIWPPCQKLWPFDFLETFHFQFQTPRYIMHLSRTSVWKIMTIGISWELPLFNFERLDILCVRIGHPCEKLWPFEFVESFRCSIFSVLICDTPESDIRVKSYNHLNFSGASVVQFLAARYVMRLNLTSVSNVMTIWFARDLPFSISCVSIYYAPESDLRVKNYDHLNF